MDSNTITKFQDSLDNIETGINKTKTAQAAQIGRAHV